MKIYKQSVFESWPLEDESINSIITSPPYFQKRVYSVPNVLIGGNKECVHTFNTDNFCTICSGWFGQYGRENDFRHFIANTLLWCKEAYRVLKSGGMFFLNVGDSYAGSNNGAGSTKDNKISDEKYKEIYKGQKPGKHCLPNKCKMLIPERIAMALCDELNFTLRNTLVWHKTAAHCESAQDRFSQKWEPIFMFSKNEKYDFYLNSVLKPVAESTKERAKGKFHSEKAEEETSFISNKASRTWSDKVLSGEVTGVNPGDLWCVTKSNSKFKHYAQWSEELVERMIKCSTKVGDTVLDPFCGSGVTIKVAKQLHRKGVGIDLGYEDIYNQRLNNIQSSFLFEN